MLRLDILSRIFEIRKAGFTNKGAAMMLIAATRAIRDVLPDAVVCVAPDITHPYQERAEQGLWHRAELIRYGADLGRVIGVLPKKLRRRYGFITLDEVDVVFDAAGFAYSDKWGVEPSIELARLAKRLKSTGKRLVLLPQAFGPFGSEAIRVAIGEAMEHIDLVFARDAISYKNLVDIVGERSNIRRAPDFTSTLPAIEDAVVRPNGERRIALVPNSRMLDKTSPPEGALYVTLMQRATEKMRDAGLFPFLLIHEGPDDMHVGERINAGLSTKMEIVWPADPLVAKGIIKGCEAVIGSRFHALVSALAQGVPVIGFTWSHKYEALLGDYGCTECLLPLSGAQAAVDETLRLLTDDSLRSSLKARLVRPAEDQRDATHRMWSEIFQELGICCGD